MRDEYLRLLQALTKVEREAAFNYIKQSRSNKQKLDEDLYKKLIEDERIRNEELANLVIAEPDTKNTEAINYKQPDINKLMAQKNKNEELESELILEEHEAFNENMLSDNRLSTEERKKIQSRNRSSLSIKSSIRGTFFDSDQENICMTPSFSVSNNKVQFENSEQNVSEGSPSKPTAHNTSKRLHKSSSSLIKKNSDEATVKDLELKSSMTKSTLAIDPSETRLAGYIPAIKFKNFEKLERNKNGSPFSRNRVSLSKAVTTIGNKNSTKDMTGSNVKKSLVKKTTLNYKLRRSQIKEKA